MSNTPPVILCPGQGAQNVGMGKAWADVSPEAAALYSRADDVLGDRFGVAFSELCFEGPGDRLNKTDAAQPALFVAGIASAVALFGEDAPYTAAAGLSLGEYTALCLAGAFTFEDGLELVALRGLAMQEAAEAIDSSMVALTGADEEKANTVCERAREDGVLVAANFNAPGQVVVSGCKAACERAVKVASEIELKATPLAVAGAFHSPIMAPAAERLATKLASITIKAPRCPVISNVTGEAHENDAESIAQKLVEQLTQPVRWSKCCETLAAQYPDAAYHELAPGKVLKGLMRRIERSIKVVNHDAPEETPA